MTHIQGWRWLGLIAVLAAGTCRLAAGGRDTRTQLPVLIPAGVAGPAGTAQATVGYVANASGGIDAINLKDGTLLWSTKDASRPLIAYKNRLAALRGNRVVILDVTRKGKKVLQSDALALTGTLTPQPGSVLLAVSGWLERGDLIVKWVGVGYTSGGVTYLPPVIADMVKEATGAVRVSLTRGFVQKLSADTAPRSAAVLPKELRILTPLPTVAGDKAAALVREEADGKQKLVLKRWDLKTGKAEAPLTLREGRGLFWRLTLDGGHAILTGGALYSLATGKKLATLPASVMLSIRVDGSRVYFLTEGPPKRTWGGGELYAMTLKAMELKTGKVVWERPVAGIQIPPPAW
jgi:outer membrane protein assembly factor BamB